MKKTALFVSLIGCIFYFGCSGRTPNPVPAYMPGDDALSCEELKIEMANVKREIALKPAKIKEREARNLWLWLCWPIGSPFEADILEAEETEIQALNNRYNNLLMIAYEKRCSTGNRSLTIQTLGGRKPTANDILKDDTSKLPLNVQTGIEHVPNVKEQ